MAESSFHTSCRMVLNFCSDPYAKAYAKAGLELHDPEEQRVQCLYILCNTAGWRGERARQVKRELRRLSKKS